jgi:hypothetical protein
LTATSISVIENLDFSHVKSQIPKKKTPRYRFEDDDITTSNFTIKPRIAGNNTAYYFEIADNGCVCGLCKSLWPGESKYSEKGRCDWYD